MTTASTSQVPSLGCGPGVAPATQALAKLEVQVQADAASKRVDVRAPQGVSRGQIEEALRAAGYPPAPAA